MKVTEHKSGKTAKNHLAAPVISQNPLGVLLPEPLLEFARDGDPQPAIVFRSEHLGEDNPVLGGQLMIEFFQALLQHHEPPQAIILYNTAIHLVLETSPVLDAIRQLAARGCEVLACKTSLQVLAPGRSPVVGRAVPMSELAGRMLQARHLLWP